MLLAGGSGGGSRGKQRILTIETASATWREIGDQALGHAQLRDCEWVFVESFAAAAQMAREGFGRALVPLGTAMALRFRRAETTPLSPPLTRQVHLVDRKSIHGLRAIGDFRDALVTGAPTLIEDAASRSLAAGSARRRGPRRRG